MHQFSLSAEVLFLDEHTSTPTDWASFLTTKRCLLGDDGRPCSSHFMAFPNACRDQYSVPWLVLLVGFIDFFDRYIVVPSVDVLVTAVLTFFLSELHVDAYFTLCPLEVELDTV